MPECFAMPERALESLCSLSNVQEGFAKHSQPLQSPSVFGNAQVGSTIPEQSSQYLNRFHDA